MEGGDRRGTVIIRPAPPGGDPAGSRPLLWLLTALLLAVAWGLGIVWLARAERSAADARVRALPKLALASFGAALDVPGWPGDPGGLPLRWGAEDRASLEARLRTVQGKVIRTAVPPAASWEPLKPAPRSRVQALPAGTRVLDSRDPVTAATLQALFGLEHFLWVVIDYSVERDGEIVAVTRVEALVFDRAARTVWQRVFVERAEAAGADAAALEHAMRLGSRQAIERLARAIE